jgi:hypothetical protein
VPLRSRRTSSAAPNPRRGQGQDRGRRPDIAFRATHQARIERNGGRRKCQLLGTRCTYTFTLGEVAPINSNWPDCVSLPPVNPATTSTSTRLPSAFGSLITWVRLGCRKSSSTAPCARVRSDRYSASGLRLSRTVQRTILYMCSPSSPGVFQCLLSRHDDLGLERRSPCQAKRCGDRVAVTESLPRHVFCFGKRLRRKNMSRFRRVGLIYVTIPSSTEAV